MFLSALTLAAMLQAAPEISLKGLPRAPRLPGPVGELAMPLPPKAKLAAAADAARARRLIQPSFVRKPRARAALLPNPHIAGCNPPPQHAAGSETPKLQPLSKMPNAHGERAVSRLVDGCAVAVPIDLGPIER